jgi:DNA helicase IV
MEFANRLIPESERALTNIRAKGPRPRIVKVSSEARLAPQVVQSASELALKYRNGSCAVIGMPAITTVVREQLSKLGWATTKIRGRLVKDSLTIELHNSESARGLEFDAVVIAEPSDFPITASRFGRLYTSMTRANNELVLVHSKPLPAQLRGK